VASGAPTAAPTAAPAGGAPAPTATDVPVTFALPDPAKSNAKVNGAWQVLQDQDFNPEHNAYVKKGIQDFAKFQGWKLDLSYVAGFSAGGSLEQKLAATVSAGTPPDLMIKDLSGYIYRFLGIVEDADDITQEMLKKYGDTIPATKKDKYIDGKWWSTPFFSRTGGYWARKDIFEAAGLDVDRDTENLMQLPETLLKVSTPDKQVWGWGMTINTCGDGESLVQSSLMNMGSRLTEETGQLIRLNSPETVTAIKWLTDLYLNPKYATMLPPGLNSWTDPSNNEAWLAGKIAFTSNAGTLYGQTVQQNKPFAKDSVLVRQPRAKDSFYAAGGASFWFFKGTKNKDASTDLVRYLLQPVAQKALFTATPGYVVPAYKTLWDDPDIRKDPNNVRFRTIAWDPAAYNGIAYPGPSTAAAAAVNSQNVYTKMAQAILGGKKPEDAVVGAHDQAVRIFKDFGMRGA
jgi:multiple sugar transport system substrate-binding protein